MGILGEVKSEFVGLLRLADNIFIEELINFGWYEKTFQAFAVFLPLGQWASWVMAGLMSMRWQ